MLELARLNAEGKALEAAGRYDDAFAVFVECNARQRAAFEKTPERCDQIADDLIRIMRGAISANWVRHYRPPPTTARPIFIVGMPRTGSTLVEQILSAHSQVTALGEVKAFPQAMRHRFTFAPIQPHEETATAIRDAYLAALPPRLDRFTDKLPSNAYFAGLALAMFPNARVIHTTRDPLDTCLSCFSTMFLEGHEFSTDLAELGREYRRVIEIMATWKALFPGRVFEVSNEALIADPKGQIGRLLKACKLAPEPACFAPHLNERFAPTASFEQVKRPINADGVGRWRHYERHLGPLIDALGDYA